MDADQTQTVSVLDRVRVVDAVLRACAKAGGAADLGRVRTCFVKPGFVFNQKAFDSLVKRVASLGADALGRVLHTDGADWWVEQPRDTAVLDSQASCHIVDVAVAAVERSQKEHARRYVSSLHVLRSLTESERTRLGYTPKQVSSSLLKCEGDAGTDGRYVQRHRRNGATVWRVERMPEQAMGPKETEPKPTGAQLDTRSVELKKRSAAAAARRAYENGALRSGIEISHDRAKAYVMTKFIAEAMVELARQDINKLELHPTHACVLLAAYIDEQSIADPKLEPHLAKLKQDMLGSVALLDPLIGDMGTNRLEPLHRAPLDTAPSTAAPKPDPELEKLRLELERIRNQT